MEGLDSANKKLDFEEDSPEKEYMPPQKSSTPNNPNFTGNQEVSQQEGSSSQNLLSAKHTRKRAEEDARLLSNRIALLKTEEQKAWKKIEETRKRAKEIMELRARNKESQRQKEEAKKQQEEEEARKAALNKAKSEALKESIKRNTEEVLQKKVKDQNETNAIKQANNDLKNQLQSEYFAKAQEIKRQRQQAQIDSQENRRKNLEDKKANARKELERRLEEEHRIRLQKEADVAQMEQEELELIQRLQNTQLLQRQGNFQYSAYEDLESALQEGVEKKSKSTDKGSLR